MSRPDYMPRQEYQADGVAIAYTFAFKIETLQQLLVLVLDPNGVVLNSLRGDDVSVLYSVIYDATEGGGTVTFIAAPTINNVIVLLEANDAPTQPYQFRNKGALDLKTIEMAYDYIMGAVQRLAYLVLGAVRLPDAVDPTDFDARLPANIQVSPNTVIGVNSTADGLVLVANPNVANAQVSTTIVAGQSATPINGGLLDSAVYTSGIYFYEILRGTTIFSTGLFSLHYRNATWYLVMWSDNRDGASVANGVTLSLTGTTIAQINAAVAADGAGNGTLKIKNYGFNK